MVTIRSLILVYVRLFSRLSKPRPTVTMTSRRRGGGNLVPPRSLLPVVPIQCLIRSCPSVRDPNWSLLDGEPSYSHYLGGFYFAPKSEALVPPRENLGGSYSMLNSIYVRDSVRQICAYLCSAKVRLLTAI